MSAEALELLRRLRGWDHLDGAADGPFWKAEIDKVLASDPLWCVRCGIHAKSCSRKHLSAASIDVLLPKVTPDPAEADPDPDYGL